MIWTLFFHFNEENAVKYVEVVASICLHIPWVCITAIIVRGGEEAGGGGVMIEGVT